jgi:predicted MFS family arabinose efflux permease
MPFYLSRQGGWSPGAVGVMLGCWAAGTMAGSALAARVIRVHGLATAARWGAALVALGLAGAVAWPAQPVAWPLVLALAVQGTGVGLFQVAYADQVVASLPASMRGVAGSLTMVTRTAGVVLGALIWAEVMDRAGAGDFMNGHRWLFGVAAAVAVALTVAMRGRGRRAAV